MLTFDSMMAAARIHFSLSGRRARYRAISSESSRKTDKKVEVVKDRKTGRFRLQVNK
jgi:hypothetical protein